MGGAAKTVGCPSCLAGITHFCSTEYAPVVLTMDDTDRFLALMDSGDVVKVRVL